ncbi:aKG-HExxH-type peptide beta-hydroxylase [Nannocystis radixulma]|uniref:HEXXH motif-containing putative peptide modification protein n=1 Tax=Nannocystis radixulma TaxID=2995305 RepID=A0ABT5BCH2_9BACT|nr:HEXXH motif-containing putative peptide modification protein [Nannocystis radixulma]MDC0671757.1 HEXXH motif-containing putative peptide modification protein [Nannocystis radixulma]
MSGDRGGGVLADLTLPAPGSQTARGLFSAALRRALTELLRLPPAPGPNGAAWGRFAPVLRKIAAQAPGALASVVRRPTVGTLIRCLRGRPDAAVQGELLATLALELAFAGVLEDRVMVPQPPAMVLCLGARCALAAPPGPLVIGPDGWAVGGVGGALGSDFGTCPSEHVLTDIYETIAGPIALALRRDNNPLAELEAHPDKSGSALDLGGQPAVAWLAGLRAGLELIATHLPALRAELDVGLVLVVPVGHDVERHLSASYQEAIGTVYLSLHPSALTLAEALIHEFSHNKLHALLEQGPILDNAWSPLYASPVRPDPRPLHGVLLAAHAFLPVAVMLESMLVEGTDDVERRLRQVARGNHEAVETLRLHARPTALGGQLLAELEALDARFRRWWED